METGSRKFCLQMSRPCCVHCSRHVPLRLCGLHSHQARWCVLPCRIPASSSNGVSVLLSSGRLVCGSDPFRILFIWIGASSRRPRVLSPELALLEEARSLRLGLHAHRQHRCFVLRCVAVDKRYMFQSVERSVGSPTASSSSHVEHSSKVSTCWFLFFTS